MQSDVDGLAVGGAVGTAVGIDVWITKAPPLRRQSPSPPYGQQLRSMSRRRSPHHKRRLGVPISPGPR